MQSCIHAYMQTYIHAYIHTWVHVYLHTCIHTYMHTCLLFSLPATREEIRKKLTDGPTHRLTKRNFYIDKNIDLLINDCFTFIDIGSFTTIGFLIERMLLSLLIL